jgi:hypothetical protein
VRFDVGTETDGQRGGCREHGGTVCAGGGEVHHRGRSRNGRVAEWEADEGVESILGGQWVERGNGARTESGDWHLEMLRETWIVSTSARRRCQSNELRSTGVLAVYCVRGDKQCLDCATDSDTACLFTRECMVRGKNARLALEILFFGPSPIIGESRET